MCIVSNIANDWNRTLPDRWPWVQPYVRPSTDSTTIDITDNVELKKLKKKYDKEIKELREELEALKKLLKAGKEYDEATGQKDCEQDEKIALFKRLAELCDVDVSEVFS